MKILFIVILAIIGTTGFLWLAVNTPGFVLLQYGSLQLETSLVVFAVMLLALIIGTSLTIRGVMLLIQLPKRLKRWRANSVRVRAGQALSSGLIALEEGRWQAAEKSVMRYAKHSDNPQAHYLLAAKSAGALDAYERRDNYLNLARKAAGEHDIAVGIVQAKLQLMAGQNQQAIATLAHSQKTQPKQPYVSAWLDYVYQHSDQKQIIVPYLRSPESYPIALAYAGKSSTFLRFFKSEIHPATLAETLHQLKTAFAHDDWHTASSVWQKTPRKMRRHEQIITAYVAGLISQHKDKEAAKLIERFLAKKWSNRLVYYYGLTQKEKPMLQLITAEKWLTNRQANPWLLLTLGRLAKANQLWGKAEDYLKSSIHYDAQGETYQVLAQVLLAEGKEQKAIEVYQHGMTFMLEQAPSPPIPLNND